MRRNTLLDFFEDFAGRREDFLVYDDGYRARTYTYRETAAAARAFAARLQAAGIGKADKVLFWSENRPEWIVAFWGCLLNGVVVVPIDYRASPDFLGRVAHIVAAKIVLVGQDVPPPRLDRMNIASCIIAVEHRRPRLATGRWPVGVRR